MLTYHCTKSGVMVAIERCGGMLTMRRVQLYRHATFDELNEVASVFLGRPVKVKYLGANGDGDLYSYENA